MNQYRSQVTEVINRNVVISLALRNGFNAFLPVYDGGVDFILYREKDNLVHKVQLKSRWTIDKRYSDRDIWMVFPIASNWYLVPHDKLVAWASPKITKSVSWTIKGIYHAREPSLDIIEKCKPYRFASITEVAAEAARGDAK